MIYKKMPKDAKEQLKKTSIINLNEDIVGFDDASRFDNYPSSGKTCIKKE